MNELTENRPVDKPAGFSNRVQRAMPWLFMIWLVLTVLSPHQDLYKAFFHLIIIPAAFILIFTKKSFINWKDPFLLISLVFFAYAGVTTLIIGLGPFENQLRAFRWAIEISLGLVAFFIWMPDVIRKPHWWGKVFLWVALVGSSMAILLFVFKSGLQGRLTGLGALHQWVQVSYILLLYFALGHFMLTREPDRLGFGHKALIVSALFSVCLAVLLSQSRISIAAMVIYVIFVGWMDFVKNPKSIKPLLLTLLVGTILLMAILVQFFGIEQYLDKLMARGMSHRIDIWTGYLIYVPDAWLFGFGSGTEAQFHPAVEGYWKPNQLAVAQHPHNLFLGTLVDTGIVGLFFLLALIYLVVAAIVKQCSSWQEKIRLLAILALIFLLSLTGGQTIISSIKAIWLYLWIPVVLIWFWSRRETASKSNDLNTE